MSTGYTTYQQHEPLRAPAGWSAQEKRFVAQLEELFDDIYKRYNRLRMEDMSPAFRKSFTQIMEDGTELRHDLDITASGLSAEITRASTAEGSLSSSINGTASAMELTFKKIGASGYTATGITTISENGITVKHSSLSNCKTEMSASGFRILNSSNAVIGGLMSLNNQVVTAMQCLYNPTYSNFVLDVGSFTGRYTTAYGITYKYNGENYGSIGTETINTYKGLAVYASHSLSLHANDYAILRAENSWVEISEGQISFVWWYNGEQRVLTANEIFEYMYGS